MAERWASERNLKSPPEQMTADQRKAYEYVDAPPRPVPPLLPVAVKRVIKGVYIIPMGMANAFLIDSDHGLTLIDAGFPGKEAAVFGAIRWLGRSLDQLKHVIFTHGHPDHVGSAAAIVRETGATTYMHPLDIPLAESGGPFRPMTPAPGLIGLLCNLFYHPDERLEPVAIDSG
jgi:glyoxylase-like metal-dependent hydrolase (beta-lactamase superfamily II)